MATLKYYDTATSEWKTLIVGAKGEQGDPGANGADGTDGADGATGPSGVISVTAPITNSGTPTSADIGIDYDTLQYGRNVIINGAFEINQRGLTSTPTLTNPAVAFGTDRWVNYIDVFSNYSYQAVNEATVPAVNCLRIGTTTTSNPYPYRLSVGQKIEDFNTYSLRGKSVTLSFYIKFSSSTFTSSEVSNPFNNFRYEIGYNTSTTNSAFFGFGNLDAPTSVANSYDFATITNGSLPTTWTRVTLTGTVPATANNIHVGFGFQGLGFTATANQLNYEISGIQLEAGTVATPFRRNAPSIQAELAACQRYYQQNSTLYFINATSGGFNNSYMAAVPFVVEMRATPTLTPYSGANFSGTAGNVSFFPGNVSLSVLQEQLSNRHFSLTYGGNSGYSLGLFTWKASAEL